MMKLALLLVLVAVAYSAPTEDVWEFEMDEIDKITDFLQTKEDLIEFLTEGRELKKVRVMDFQFKDCSRPTSMAGISSVSIMPDPIALPCTTIEIRELEKVRVTDFQFKDCGGPTSMTGISSVSIMPDPIALPGTITVGTNFMIKKNFGMPLSIDLTIEKKVLGKFIKVPCIDNFGSCTYGGLCGDLEQVTCPDQLVKIGIDCRCPFKAASYMFPPTGFDVDASLPLPSGDYHVNANAMSNGTQAACIDIIFTLK